jgi:DNA-binding CsgD family transcriptional regulator
MATLTHHDLEQAELFLRGLYRLRRVQPLIWYVLKELPTLVDANQTSWNAVKPALRQADVMAWPEQAEHGKFQAALARNLHEHPLIGHFRQTGDPTAIKISDFLSRDRFHGTGLYDELYRGLRYEDQFAMNLQPLGPQWDTIVVARDKRSFTERDRLLLNLLRPHIAQAYRQSRVFSRLARRIDAQRGEPATTQIVLDANDRIIVYPAGAQRWIEWYFDGLPNTPQHLPDVAQRWLADARGRQLAGKLERVPTPLRVRRFGRQLIVRLIPLDESRGTVLMLEERADSATGNRFAGLRLTPRQMEVLLEVQKGKRNEEIAAALGIRPLTVKKHLEHIFDRLGVESRTAAVARLHEANTIRR